MKECADHSEPGEQNGEGASAGNVTVVWMVQSTGAVQMI